MKKNMIALLISIVMTVGSIGGTPVLAADTTEEEASAEIGTMAATDEVYEQEEMAEPVEDDIVEPKAEEDPDEEISDEDANGLDEFAADIRRQKNNAEDENHSIDSTVPEEAAETIKEPTKEELEAEVDYVADTYVSSPIHYTVDSSGNATITEYDSGEENVVIPESIDGHPVIAIGPKAFYEDSVIKTVSLPEGLITIGDQAFAYCSNIEQLNIPSTVRTLGSFGFTHLKITELTLPEGITGIPVHCFAYCGKLSDVHLPNTLKRISDGGFGYCSSLTNIDLPDGLTTIDEGAFNGCNEIKWETLPDGVETINHATIYNVNPPSGVFTFSKNVKTINEYEFYKCKEFNFLGDAAPAVPNLRLDKNYTIHIRSGASGFNVKPWTNANIIRDLLPPVENGQDEPTSPIHYTVDSSGNATITEYDSGEENVVIPESIDGHQVVAIGPKAFYEDSVIKTVSLPEGLITIGDQAFEYCSNIEQLNIPSTVRTLGSFGFRHLKITELTLPEGITVIPVHCFAYCGELSDVHLPSTLKRIAGGAFGHCSSLTNIDLPDGLTTIDEYAFESHNEIKWETLPDGVETINYATIYNVNPPSGVFTFSKNVKTINEYEFYKCKEFAFNGYTAPSAPNLRLSKDYTIHIREGATGFDRKPWTNATIVSDIEQCSVHDWDNGIVIKAATCLVEGEVLLTCNVCGLTKSKKVPKTDHNWNEEYTIDKEPTYTEEGAESIHCSVCGEIKEGTQRSIAKMLKPVSMLTISGITAKTYNGKAQTQTVIVKDGDLTLEEGPDYTVSYKDNTNAGTASVVIKGEGNYTGEVIKTFTIKKAPNTITAKSFTRTYSTKAQTFSLGVKIKDGTPTYKSSTKYVTVSKAGKVTVKAKFIGKATITITSPEKANYSKQTKKITITVNPTKTALVSVASPSAGKMTVKWKKNAVGTGYQIQYSTSSKFTSTKAVSITKNTTLTKTIGSLAKGKKYYVRIRTYKTVGKTKFYSGWSAAKTVTIKK